MYVNDLDVAARQNYIAESALASFVEPVILHNFKIVEE